MSGCRFRARHDVLFGRSAIFLVTNQGGDATSAQSSDFCDFGKQVSKHGESVQTGAPPEQLAGAELFHLLATGGLCDKQRLRRVERR